METPSDAEKAPLRPEGAQLAAWTGLLLVNAAIIAIKMPWPRAGVRVRLLHHLHDAGAQLAAGLIAAAAVGLWLRFGPGRLRESPSRLRRVLARGSGYAALAALSVGAGFAVLDDDLDNFTARMTEDAPGAARWLLPALIVVVSLGVPGAAALGRLLARPWLRWAGVALAAALAVANHVILPNDYPGAHLYLIWAAAALGAASLSGARLPVAGPRRRRAALGLHAAAALLAAVALVVPPTDSALVNLERTSGSPLPPLIARVRASLVDESEDVVLGDPAWFTRRDQAPEVKPSPYALVPPSAVVILLLIDSVRADVLADPSRRAALPEMFRLMDEGVTFTQARSPGAQTTFSVPSLFASKYPSQLLWSKNDKGSTVPHADPSIRFTELLARQGVPTVNFASKLWLVNESGVVRGFTEEQVVNPKAARKLAPRAAELMNAALARLGKVGGGPMFLYIHFMDAHSPYQFAGKEGQPFERYIRCMRLVDLEIGRLRKALEAQGAWDRTVLMISADHGEAFGEHGTSNHGKTLYDELIRVPLVVRVPEVSARSVDVPVSLVDLGPTILDLYGLPAPGSYMGQSLVPLLAGRKPALTRPIAAEGRTKQAMIFPDGIKVIHDQGTHGTEVYDLEKDPKEEENLFEARGGAKDERVQLSRQFFRAHVVTPIDNMPRR